VHERQRLAAHSTGASCAFHLVCLADGASGRTTKCLSHVNSIRSASGDQQMSCTVPSDCAKLARNMPVRDLKQKDRKGSGEETREGGAGE
jgi:hypothetical protein